jgi:hypothetical protein
MALISWGAGLILPVRSKLLGDTWTAGTFGIKIHASESSLATFRRKIRFLSLRTIAPRKTKPPGGDRRLEIV